jgi:hypothetical protein
LLALVVSVHVDYFHLPIDAAGDALAIRAAVWFTERAAAVAVAVAAAAAAAFCVTLDSMFVLPAAAATAAAS